MILKGASNLKKTGSHHGFIKSLLKHIRRRIYLWKVDYIYNSCFVIEEGMPPSYYLTHTQEEIERDRQETIAAIDRLIQTDKNRK